MAWDGVGEADELRAVLGGQAVGNLNDKAQEFGCVVGFDLVPGIAGLVVVGVETGEEEQDGSCLVVKEVWSLEP